MTRGRLVELAEELERQGVQVAHLRGLQDELDAIERPSMLGRLSAAARASAQRHWRHVVGELQESAEVVGILQRRVRGSAPLSAEELDKVQGQLGDLLRVVPAGMLALANSALPVPGTGLLTPWLLSRLGLMPSRWREAHLLSELREQEAEMRAAGQTAAADRLGALAEDIEEEADAREAAARHAALLTCWDDNANGRLEDDELAAYSAELLRLRGLPMRERARRCWFLRLDDQLFGPCRLSELPQLPPQALVSHGGSSGWVALDDLLGHEASPREDSA